MTVSELIAELQKMPGDKPVSIIVTGTKPNDEPNSSDFVITNIGDHLSVESTLQESRVLIMSPERDYGSKTNR